MWFVRTVFVPYLSKDSRKAAQGVQPLVRSIATKKPGHSSAWAVGSAGRTTWSQTMYRSAPLVPKGFSRFVHVFRFLSLPFVVFTP